MPEPGSNGRPRAVVFDLGGVLLDWNPRYLYRKLFDDEAEMEQFLSEVCTLDWHRAHDLGVRPEETSPPLAAAHPEQAELIWAWTRRTEEMLAGPIDGSVAILRELTAAGVPCYALTNMESWTYPGRRERYPFLTWFDGTVVSGFEGVAKPDPRVFQLLLDRFGLTAAEHAVHRRLPDECGGRPHRRDAGGRVLLARRAAPLARRRRIALAG